MELVLDPATELDSGALAAAGVLVRDLVTVLGNLIDNAIDAVSARSSAAGRPMTPVTWPEVD